MNHPELVKRAEKWLLNTIGCGFVLHELSSASLEIPDAIGWKNDVSHIVECKTSRADFLADAKKLFRKWPDMGIGNYRYYLCEPEIIKVEDLPEYWGLLWVIGAKRIRMVRKPEAFLDTRIAWNERPILCSALRRVHIRDDLEKIYERSWLKNAQ